MRAWLRSVAVLALASAAAVFPPPGGSSEQAHSQQSGGIIQPDVLGALQQDSEVAVVISLPPPAASLADASLTEMRDNTAEGQASVLSVLTTSDFTVTYQYSMVPALAGRITSSGVEKLAGHPGVLSVAIDNVFTAGLEESVPLIHADDGGFESLGLDGTGVTVAVMDSGIDTDHPDLRDSILGGKCFLDGHGADCPSGLPYEDDWVGTYHGTHVSGIITSDGDNDIAPRGVAPNADIFVYKIIGAPIGPIEGRWAVSDLAAALNDIIDP